MITYKSIGRTYLKQQMLEEAKNYTKKALMLIKSSPSVNAHTHKDVSNQLADIYELINKPKQVSKYRIND